MTRQNKKSDQKVKKNNPLKMLKEDLEINSETTIDEIMIVRMIEVIVKTIVRMIAEVMTETKVKMRKVLITIDTITTKN